MADFFGDGPFENILEEFFGNRNRGYRRQRVSRGDEEDIVIDVLEDGRYAYLIFELPGFTEEDILINVKGKTIEISAEKKDIEGMKEYLAQKLSNGMKYTRTLPENIDGKDYEYTMNNGILEIRFERR